nr:MAG TPA_asm: hypothetical protein [Caudoviricetes sp.]
MFSLLKRETSKYLWKIKYFYEYLLTFNKTLSII